MAPRVLFVHNSGDLYGASRSLLRLLPRLQAGGEEVLALLAEDGPLRRLLEVRGIEVSVDPSISIITRQRSSPVRLAWLAAGLPLSASRIARFALDRHVDLVHTNTGVILSPALAARRAGIPHVWHIRDSFHEFQRAWPVHARYILALSRRVIAVSSAIAAQFPTSPKMTVVHNGIALEEFDGDFSYPAEELRRRHRLGGVPVIGCVGRIKLRRKGQEHLLAAAARLRAPRPRRAIPRRRQSVSGVGGSSRSPARAGVAARRRRAGDLHRRARRPTTGVCRHGRLRPTVGAAGAVRRGRARGDGDGPAGGGDRDRRHHRAGGRRRDRLPGATGRCRCFGGEARAPAARSRPTPGDGTAREGARRPGLLVGSCGGSGAGRPRPGARRRSADGE